MRTGAEFLRRHAKSAGKGASTPDALALGDIVSESDRLAHIVEQMLILAQADAGDTGLVISDVAVGDLVQEVSRSMRALAEQRGLTLETSTDDDLTVPGDRQRLRELLVVLLDNAIKYTDAGGRIEVSTHRTHKGATIRVSDTGHGIPPEALPHIFDRFYRVDKARSRESGGAGLGLAIARHVVNAHGGTIGISSEVDRGTAVTVHLPSRPNPRRQSPLPEA